MIFQGSLINRHNLARHHALKWEPHIGLIQTIVLDLVL